MNSGEKSKSSGGFAICAQESFCYNYGKMRSAFYSRYYKRSDAERRRAFCVLSLGYNRCAARSSYIDFQRRHPKDRRFLPSAGRTLDSLVVVHISSGHGSFRSELSGEMPVPANSVFFVFPGVNHFYRYDDETGWDEEWVEFVPDAALPVLESAGISPSSPLRTFAAVPSVAEAFQHLFDVSRRSGDANLLLEAAAHRVLAEASLAWNSGDADTAAGLAVERMRQVLTSDISEPGTVQEAARKAGRSVSRMRELFKRATGLSPKKYQMRARLVRAGRLLRDTDLPVSQVAEQTGFGSLFSFSHRFRKMLGVSPSEYRKEKSR